MVHDQLMENIKENMSREASVLKLQELIKEKMKRGIVRDMTIKTRTISQNAFYLDHQTEYDEQVHKKHLNAQDL